MEFLAGNPFSFAVALDGVSRENTLTAWNFIVSLLAGAGVSIVVGLVFIGRYQQKIEFLEAAIPKMQTDLTAALTGLAGIQGELRRMNGRGH